MKSTILDKPFDIQEVDLIVDGIALMHLAPDGSGINQIAPLEDGTDAIYKNAQGDPIGRAESRLPYKRMAYVTISIYANSPYAETMMDVIGDPVTASIVATDDAGTTLTKFAVHHVLFSYPALNFNSAQHPLVFRGMGWDISVQTV